MPFTAQAQNLSLLAALLLAIPGVAQQTTPAPADNAQQATGSATTTADSGIGVSSDFSLAQPFTARFDIQLDDKPMGYGEMSLRRLDAIDKRPDLQQFEVEFSSKATSGMAKLARFRSLEETAFVVQNNSVYPLTYSQNESMLFSKDVWRASFDWQLRKLSVASKDGSWDQLMDNQTVDSLSIYLLLASQAMRSAEAFQLSLLKEDKITDYQWTRLPEETISNACGEFTTVVYEGTLPGSDKTIWTWHAPALHWLPVRIRKNRDSDSYFQIDLNAIDWQEEPALSCGEQISNTK